MSVFDEPAVRMAIQRVVMDEIFIDPPAGYQIRVPDRLVDELERVLSPYLKDEARGEPETA